MKTTLIALFALTSKLFATSPLAIQSSWFAHTENVWRYEYSLTTAFGGPLTSAALHLSDNAAESIFDVHSNRTFSYQIVNNDFVISATDGGWEQFNFGFYSNQAPVLGSATAWNITFEDTREVWMPAPASNTVPEPSAFILSIIAVTWFIIKRKRN